MIILIWKPSPEQLEQAAVDSVKLASDDGAQRSTCRTDDGAKSGGGDWAEQSRSWRLLIA